MNLSPISGPKPNSPSIGAPEAEGGPKANPLDATLDALNGVLPRSQGLTDKLAAASRSRWLTLGAPAAVVVLGAGAAVAFFGGWMAPSGAPLQDGAREDLTRSILYGDRTDGPDAPAATGSPQDPAGSPSRADGPDETTRPSESPVPTRHDGPDATPSSSPEAGASSERGRDRSGALRRGSNPVEFERTARPVAPIR